MNEFHTINPDDARLTRQLVFESQAATAAYDSTRIRNICIGSGAVILAAGIGLAALVWAWGQGVDPDALKAALADMPPIKVETTVKDGEVTLRDGGEVTLKDGGTVGIDPNARIAVKEGGKVIVDGTVGIDSNATVKVAGEVPATSALEKRIDALQNQPKGDDAIKREVTVFNTVAYSRGNVVTGWVYANGAADKPSSQFCYFREGDRITDLAENGVTLTQNRRKMSNFGSALTKCQWWRGAA